MNKYLFRGKIKDTNEWIYGGIAMMGDRYFIVKTQVYNDDDTCSWVAVEVESETICCFILPFDIDNNHVCNAVEKQIKKKPLLIDGRMKCPVCKSNRRSLGCYCDECGQAIDWSDEL